MDDVVKSYPSPWNLSGNGYIFLYKFSKKFVEQYANVPIFLNDSFVGGLGSVMLVNYEKSNAGPYGELLFIPGKFRFNRKKLDTISKIYVSTKESVFNGRINWGIPKEQADFSFVKIDDNTEKIRISINEQMIAEYTLKSGRLSFPVSTKLLPFPLVQLYKEKYYFTKFFGKGKGHVAKIKDVKINSDYFPDVSLFRPLAVIRVEPFDITFPKADIELPTEK